VSDTETVTTDDPTEATPEASAAPEGALDAGTPEEPEETPEGPEEPAEDDDDPQQAPPIQQAHRTPEQIEASIASWDREKSRHMRELEKRDDVRFADTVECPLCEGHGRMWPVLPEPESTARREFINGALGGAPEADYREHPTESICDSCDGWGQVYTGSKVANQDLLNCPACNGLGHRVKQGAPLPMFAGQPPATVGSQPGYEIPYSTVPMSEQVRIGKDAWQRDPGHPHYGVPPASPNAQPAYAGQV